MDGEGLKLEFTARGIAALWLRNHAPTSSQADIDSLGQLFEGVWADGVKKGLEKSLDVMAQSPTLSAAEATIEADKDELIRAYAPKKDEG